LGRPSIAGELVDFLRNSVAGGRDALWLFADPVPALEELYRTLGQLVRADVRRVLGALLPAALKKKIHVYRDIPLASRNIYLRQEWRRLLNLGGGKPSFKHASVKQILFICHGNIIRSAMAESSLKCKLQGTAAEDIKILSAGLWEGLTSITPRQSPEAVQAAALQMGLSLAGHLSKPVTQSLIDNSDLVFVMDYQNEAMLLSKYPSARRKMYFLGGYVNGRGAAEASIADPWGRPEADMRQCLEGIDQAISYLAKDVVRLCHH